LTIPLAARFCNKNFAFTPKLGIGLETPHINFYLDGYRMTQFPTMDDLYWDSNGYHGNPDLIPESGWGGDFSTNVHNVWLPFSVCVFSNYYENKIKWSYVSDTWTPQNVASAFYLGVDFNFEKSFWQDRIIIKGNCEYLYTKLLNKGSSEYGNKIMWTPDFVGGLTLQCNFPKTEHFPKTTLIADVNYTGKRYVSNLNISYLKPYTIVNLAVQSTFNKAAWEFVPYLRLDNLLNTSYESIENYPMPGISISVGCKIRT
jgi:outer membrane cobalamin receptor